MAQTGNGVVRGLVLDPAKAAVPGAKVELMNLGTNIANQATSTSTGDYYFGNVQPGRYRLTVELAGFKKWAGTLTLEVGQNALIDIPMEVGDLATTITVEGATT
ncbi:MAG: carboxypeptidase-like regulatory domain-containing protein, partial [Bryobacteraceae bacterium]